MPEMLRRTTRSAAVLKRIESALARIDADDYGFFLSCEEEISLPRLSSDPAIILCITCAVERERR